MPHRFSRPPRPKDLEWVDTRGYVHKWACVAHALCHARWIWTYIRAPPANSAPDTRDPSLFYHILFEADMQDVWPAYIHRIVHPPARLPHQALLELRAIETACHMQQPHKRRPLK